ncbi:hypothetical protein BB560_000186 [Smittium megazygosporum]|uniref:Large ribosomal subunit protein bL21m n=1 Tax=Smittium megazygosporum TaxID=133381 RepID=A0A2T9ZL85_9FUNG|nr:hypothetical protein BB560_000186 [Smittium megazygosporum]
MARNLSCLAGTKLLSNRNGIFSLKNGTPNSYGFRTPLFQNSEMYSKFVFNRKFSTETSKDSETPVSMESQSGSLTETNSSDSISCWDSSNKKLLELLTNELDFYATVAIKGRKFTVTKGDTIVMDRMNDLNLGDTIALNQVSELGSKNYTLSGAPYINQGLVSIEATVIDLPEGKTVVTFKKKRRKGYQRTVQHKHRRTLLRISRFDVHKV